MKKRAFAIFLAVFLCIFGIAVRTGYLMLSVKSVAGMSSGKRIDISTVYGTVYDCNLKPLTNSEYEYYSAAKPTVRALEALKDAVKLNSVSSIKERMQKKYPVVVKTEYKIENCSDVSSVAVPVRYASDSLACHILGYKNSQGEGISGIEKAYNSVLNSSVKDIYARFSTDANGSVLLGEEIEVLNCTIPQNGVVLTINKEIQMIVEAALDESGSGCSAAVVIEVKNGAVRACASRPLYNQNEIELSLNDTDSPLINRAFMAFNVGSVFKPVVTAAALDNGVDSDFEYECTGSLTLNGVVFNCHKKDGHGILDMKGAVTNSCNTYFIELAQHIGAEKIIAKASDFGFGKETKLDENIDANTGYLPDLIQIDSKAALANLSFGQGYLTATPLQICSMMATIANNGLYVKPYLVEGTVDEDGILTRKAYYSENKQILTESNAKILKSFLLNVVEEGSGKRAKSEIVSCAGKTATAQTGKFNKGEEIYNAWFAGYFPAETPKYALVIMREDGGEGAISCAPVFKKIAEQITLSE